MIPLKGINTDIDAGNLSREYALDILNAVIYKGNILNEEGFKIHSSYLKDNNLSPIGILAIDNGQKIYLCIGSDGDYILILDKQGNFTQKLKANLGFNIDYPVDIEAQYNHKKELVIAITDGLNSPKVINLDNLPNPFNLSSLEMFPVYKEPVIDTELIDGGGQLKSGVYYIFIRYIDFDGSLSDSSHITNPISVGPSNESNFDDFQGSAANQPTTKGIQVKITNIDNNYEKIQIGIIQKLEGVISTQIVKEIFTSGVTTYIITGAEDFDDVTIEEVIASSVKYKTIKHLTQVDGTLYGAGVTEEQEKNFQKYINRTTLSWVSEVKDFNNINQSYKVHDNIFYSKSFSHGEVYAFYIRIKIKGGGWTKAFHIPGRAVESLPLGGMENDLNSSLLNDFGTQYPYLSYDLLIDYQSKYYQTQDTTRNIFGSIGNFSGQFGFWENEDETYPNIDDFSPVNGSEDLRGKKVRHHRFPSYKKMISYNNGIPEYGFNKRDILGVRVVFPIEHFPSEIAEQIEAYELLYAERNSSNSTIIGEGTAFRYSVWFGGYDVSGTNLPVQPNPGPYGFMHEEFLNKLNFNGGDIQPRSKETDIKFVDEWKIIKDSVRFRVYIPELLYSKSADFPQYAEPLYVFRKKMFVTGDTGQGPYFIGKREQVISPDVTDTISGYDTTLNNYNTRVTKTVADRRNHHIKEFNYVPQGVTYKDINNRNSEEFLNMTLDFPIYDYPLDDNIDTVYAFSFKSHKKNIANSFYSQKLVSTGKVFLAGSYNNIIYAGDVFISHYSYITHSNRLAEGTYKIGGQTTTPPRQRYRFLRTLLTESKININFRYEDVSDKGSYFYPRSKVSGTDTWFLNYGDEVTYNKMLYNMDYSSVNNLNAIQPYNYVDENFFVGEDAYKIIRSNIRKPEERNPSWRRFGANDYYIIPRDKGIITNIQGISSNLFINTESTLYITSSNEQLNVDGATAVIGAGDIFGRSLRELVPDQLGYSGCRNKYSCLLTPLGYFFVDTEKKRVFLSDGSSVKDINNGNSIFFEKALTNEIDNPYKDTGYTVGWDDKYSRIVLSKISGEKFTRSYYPTIESWFSRHSYNPSYIYNDRKDLYSLKDGVIYKHNENNYGNYYGITYPFHIVSVFNEGLKKDLLLSNIKWNTEVYLDNEYLKDTTFNKILVWNRYQSTGDINIETFDTSKSLEDNFGVTNTRRAKSYWQFNSLRDAVINSRLPFISEYNSIPSNISKDKEFQLKRKLIDTFFVYKLLFNNQKISKLDNELASPRIEVIDVDYSFNLVRR